MSCSVDGPVAVAERDVVELDRAPRVDDRSSIGLVGDPRLQVEQLEDPLGAGARLLRGGEHARQEAHRRDDLHQVAGEGEEHAEGDVPVERQPAADAEHAELAEHRQQPAASRSSGR